MHEGILSTWQQSDIICLNLIFLTNLKCDLSITIILTIDNQYDPAYVGYGRSTYKQPYLASNITYKEANYDLKH